MRVKCLAQEHNAVPRPGLEPGPLDPESRPPRLPQFLFRLRRYSNTRDCFIGCYLNTSNFVKNTPLRIVFATPLSVFGYPDETLSLVLDILRETPILCESVVLSDV